MATISETLRLVFAADSSQFEKGIGASLAQLEVLRGALMDMTAPIDQLQEEMVYMASSFETSMANVSTLLGEGGEDLERYKTEIIALSTEIPQSALELSEALYQAISAGVDTAEAMNFLEAAGKAATAGMTSTFVAVDGGTSVLNAFNLEASESNRVFDLMFQAVRDGKITFEQMSTQMGMLAPTAAAAGIEIEQMFGAIATATGKLRPEQAFTGLAGAITELNTPSSKAEKALKRLGYENLQTALETESLQEILVKLVNSGEKIDAVFGREAARAVNAVGGSAEKATEHLKHMNEAVGATETAFEKVNATFENSEKHLQNVRDAVKISIGQEMMPTLTKWNNVQASILEQIQEMPGGFHTVIGSGMMLANTLGNVTNKAGTFARNLKAIKDMGEMVNLMLKAKKIASIGAAAAEKALAAGQTATAASAIGQAAAQKAATAATLSFSAAVHSAMPWMLAITAAVAAAAGVYMLLKDNTLKNAKANLEAAQKERDQIKELVNAKEEASNLAKEYSNLAEKENRSAAETKRMEELYGEVSKAYPKLTSGTRDWNQRLREMNDVLAKGGEEIDKYNQKLAQTERLIATEKLIIATKELENASKGFVSGVMGATLKVQAQDYEDSIRSIIDTAMFNLDNKKSIQTQLDKIESEWDRQQNLFYKARENRDKKAEDAARKKMEYLSDVATAMRNAAQAADVMVDSEKEIVETGEAIEEASKTGKPSSTEERLDSVIRKLAALGVEFTKTGDAAKDLEKAEKQLAKEQAKVAENRAKALAKQQEELAKLRDKNLDTEQKAWLKAQEGTEAYYRTLEEFEIARFEKERAQREADLQALKEKLSKELGITDDAKLEELEQIKTAHAIIEELEMTHYQNLDAIDLEFLEFKDKRNQEARDKAKQEREQELNDAIALYGGMTDAAMGFFDAIGQAAITGETDVIKQQLKNLLMQTLDYLQTRFVLAQGESLISAIFSGGSSLIANVPLLIAAEGALGIARGMVAAFDTSGMPRTAGMAYVEPNDVILNPNSGEMGVLNALAGQIAGQLNDRPVVAKLVVDGREFTQTVTIPRINQANERVPKGRSVFDESIG